jgi:CRISPR-associated DxTHG motif protein
MVISILGMAGRDREGINKITAYYDCDSLNKKSGDYYNATDMLLKNYNDNFYFLGTQKAIEFQKELLEYDEREVEFIEIEDNSLDDIFEEVFSLISSVKDNEKVLLDITHGFRHQPISAIFSATLHKFLNDSKLDIIFAKQVKAFQEYEYIYLNEYVEMTQLSLLLTGFIRTLNFVNTVEIDNLNTLAFESFSRALLSNDFKKLELAYKNLEITLQQAKKNKKFKHLSELFEQVEEILKDFKDFDKKELYEKYMILAQIMFSKNYYLLSLTYLFEAIRLYSTYSFRRKNIINNYAWNNFDRYGLNRDVMSCITQKEFGDDYKKTYYDKNNHNFYEKNRDIFEKIAIEYKKLKELRNSLTHINHKKSQPNIKSDLYNLLGSVGDLIKKDILKDLKR